MASTSTLRSNMVTRRKKRDLETTMKSLKKLLEPNIRSRKKNIPRSIPKVVPRITKSINRFESYENSSDDGEYYPNKLKRKVKQKKIMLKPKHSMKIVVATNKRKRATPVKGHQQAELTEICSKSPVNNQHTLNSFRPDTGQQSNLQALTIQPVDKVSIYELMSPPHRSLKELTADDLMRMDEDSLSEDDLMEVLTCPSPVWWEEPPDDSNEGILYFVKSGNRKEDIENSTNTNYISEELKIAASRHDKKNTNKINKLESILGNIKNRVQNSCDRFNDIQPDCKRNSNNSKIDLNILANTSKISNNHMDRDSLYCSDDSKLRKISTSGSDISINEDDLLKNLENINIPVLNDNINNTNSTENLNFGVVSKVTVIGKDDVIKLFNESSNCRSSGASTNVSKSCIKREKPNILHKKKTNQNECIDIESSSEKYDKETPKEQNPPQFEPTNIQNTHTKIDIISKVKLLNREKSERNYHLKDDEQTDDILDVKLIKTPTNNSNEVKIWSTLDNFKPHNFNINFDNIDVENELKFSMIKSNNIGEDKNNETIFIDDDDDVQLKEAKIRNRNEKFNSNHTDMAEIIPIDAAKNILKEDTITINKHLDVRLIETEQNVKTTKSNAVFQLIKSPKLTEIKPNELQGIRILPVCAINMSNQPIIKKQNMNTKTLVRQYTNNKSKIGKKFAIVTGKNHAKVIRINDVDISLVKTKTPVQNNINAVKNDLCITLVKNDNDNVKNEINDKNNTSNMLPTLIKFPASVDSPKSISSSSETVDLSEGAISDTNIQFLDDYDDDKKSVEIVFDNNETLPKNETSKVDEKFPENGTKQNTVLNTNR